MKSLLLVLSSLLGSISISNADPILPEGWRLPLKIEITNNISKGHDRDPYEYTVTKADFNGDGILDTAQLLVNDKANKMGLFVFLSKDSGFKTIQLDEMNDKAYVDGMGLLVAKPGEYKTACGKGYWECKNGVPKLLNLKRPAINYFGFGSANSFYVWFEKSNTFTRVWMSD